MRLFTGNGWEAGQDEEVCPVSDIEVDLNMIMIMRDEEVCPVSDVEVNLNMIMIMHEPVHRDSPPPSTHVPTAPPLERRESC